jgi:hypothetical protein
MPQRKSSFHASASLLVGIVLAAVVLIAGAVRAQTPPGTGHNVPAMPPSAGIAGPVGHFGVPLPESASAGANRAPTVAGPVGHFGVTPSNAAAPPVAPGPVGHF